MQILTYYMKTFRENRRKHNVHFKTPHENYTFAGYNTYF
jgi:hypothetical protein